jgi:hypothetical protein
MRLPHWLRTLAARPNRTPAPRAPRRPTIRPRVEELEDRSVPAVITVTNTLDNSTPSGAGVSLREAIQSINAGMDINSDVTHTGAYGVGDTINFNIAATDSGHVYYRDDGVRGQLTMANVVQTTATSDLSNTDRDPDYEASWWTIRPTSVLPAITKPVFIDGFSQPGAQAGSAGQVPVFRIELDGSQVLANDPVSGLRPGLTIAGGSSTVEGLVINRFIGGSGVGIEITGGRGNTIQGNFIGTDISGSRLAGNPVANNLDPTTMWTGINVEGTSDHNLIGTFSDGTGEGNVVCGAGGGIGLRGPGVINNALGGFNTVAGNTLGVGSSVYSNPTTYSDNGVTHLMGNAFGVGTLLYAHDDQIGAGAPGSGQQGVQNLISGNLVSGVNLGGGGNQIAGEYGGIVAGNTITHNGHAGIVVDIDSQNCLIEANEIAFNGQIGNTQVGNAPGVWIFEFQNRGVPEGISVLGNSIHDNTGLGIDLGGTVTTNLPYGLSTPGINPAGPTANDSPNQATGPNHYQNYPVLSTVTVTVGLGKTTFTGTFHSTPNGTFRLQFFDNAAPDGEGQYFVGEATVTTDASGNLATSPDGSATITYDVASQQYYFTTTLLGTAYVVNNAYTATATNLVTGDTSEFSPEVQLPFALTDVAPIAAVSEGQSVTLQATIVTDPNNEPLTVSWGFAEFNADGSVGPPVYSGVVGTNTTLTWSQLVALGINDGPSTWVITMKVSDNQGNSFIAGPTNLNVANTPPTAAVSGPTTAVAGQVLAFTLGTSDPSPVDQAAGFTYTVDWGDGAPGAPDVQTFAVSAGNGAGLAATHAYAAAGNYTVSVTATDKDGGTSAASTATVQVNPMTAANLQASLSPGGTVAIVTTNDADAQAAIAAVNALVPDQTPVSTLNVQMSGKIGQVTVNAPPNLTLYINGVLTPTGTTLDPAVPALVINSGNVIVSNVTFTESGDAPTIVVTGGSLTLRNDTIQESTGYNDPAISVTGGLVDLGTASSSGGNTINVNGAGAFVQNTTSNPIPAVGDAFTVNGSPLTPSSLSGVVWEDFNDDGQVDFGESGIDGMTVTLTGTDDLGNPVTLSQTTNSGGAYVFPNLRPGNYYLTETPPAGYLQGIDSVGTAGGSVVAADQLFVQLGLETNGLNYNFGELPPPGGAVQRSQTAGIGFWENKNGQALIKALNGGSTDTQLAQWLALTLPNMYGAQAGAHSLVHADGSYFSNAEVAAFFQSLFQQKGPKLDAEVLATALSVYATNAALDNTQAAAHYGFTVSGDGAGTATVSVGNKGAAFGVANNTRLTLMDLLLATNKQAVNGLLYNGDSTLRDEADAVFSDVNDAGDIH